jgi:hypothetical protein
MRRTLWLTVAITAALILAAGNAPLILSWARSGGARLGAALAHALGGLVARLDASLGSVLAGAHLHVPAGILPAIGIALVLKAGLITALLVRARRRRAAARLVAEAPAATARRAREQRLAQDAVRLLEAVERAAGGAGAGRSCRTTRPGPAGAPAARPLAS